METKEIEPVRTAARKWTLYSLAAGALLILIFAILVIHSKNTPKPSARLEHALHRGDMLFDSYTGEGKITIADERPLEASNLAGAKFITATGTIVNAGDRTVSGIELRTYVLDEEGKAALDRITAVIPLLRRQPLPPGGSTPFSITIGNVPASRQDLAQVKVEIVGLQFQE